MMIFLLVMEEKYQRFSFIPEIAWYYASFVMKKCLEVGWKNPKIEDCLIAQNWVTILVAH